MLRNRSPHVSCGWLHRLPGWLGPDAYSTGWVALVPQPGNPTEPAWPQALDYLRSQQLPDGGWGEPSIYYAHERTLSTLGAIMALHEWDPSNEDKERINAGLAALRRYAGDLAKEPHEPIGFELLVPRLRDLLTPEFGSALPHEAWAPIDKLGAEKLAIIQKMNPDPSVIQAWWFSMELLPETQLVLLDDTLLDDNGSIATSTAATAAYLRARRRAGFDSPRAANFLEQLVERGQGGAPVGWPFDVFERIWALDSFMRADLRPDSPEIMEIADSLLISWDLNEPGLSYSSAFPVNDGDDTLVGFAALNWAGLVVSNEAVLVFWDVDHFKTYMDERGASVSVNIHALTALRSQPGFPNRDLAEKVTEWVKAQMRPDTIFADKWHLSPCYLVAHTIPAFAGWDDSIAEKCIAFLLENQRPDGGWGWFECSTLEETSHCVLGLAFALQHGFLEDDTPLRQAARFFAANADKKPTERLWIGKTLYRPEGIVAATLVAAKASLERLGFWQASRSEEPDLSRFSRARHRRVRLGGADATSGLGHGDVQRPT